MLIEALMPAAHYHLRRRMLRQAEAHLLAAKQLLALSRCLPSEEAEVLLELARVLRLQVRDAFSKVYVVALGHCDTCGLSINHSSNSYAEGDGAT
jgi:hypothetical protein